ncbi:MAG: hypothetical protein M4D80_03415 [Myxococcota bacterium]|nr:hypothetical protein [Deltaproteobacteria bacterium]MDQ3334184.1 hypothetical protein [Myxococcota bacterium]
MTQWIFSLALVACGGGDDNNTPTPDGPPTPTGLACEAITYCSTWSANSSTVTAPTDRGGTIADGIYRLERGTFAVQLLQFQGSRVNAIGDSFENRSGTYTTANGNISFSYDKRCEKSGTTTDTGSWTNRPYYVANTDTLLIAMADSGTGVVWYEYKRVAVDQICTENANVKCGVTNCSCAVATNRFGTVMSGVKSCSSQ